MMIKYTPIFILWLFLFSLFQTNSTFGQKDSLKVFAKRNYILPTIGISYGVLALSLPSIKEIDLDVNTKLKGDSKIRIDDFFPAIPYGCVYGLNIIGEKGKSNLKDYTYKVFLANAINLSIILSTKYTTKIQRPDLTTFNSFPSGHTSIAFVGAELLHQEYGHKSLWYSIAGYSIASATGYLRMHNNRHWLSDVVTGAGLGVLSTKFTYWLYPKLKRSPLKKSKSDNTYILVPSYNGFAFSYNF